MRHGSDAGLVTLGGRQVPINRPRLRRADRSAEVQLPTYQVASSTELLGRQAMARMLAKLSTRRYQIGLEPMGETISAKTRSVSKSAVSRRFVAATESALAELMAVDLSGLDLVAIMVDGVHFAQHLCVVALGIDIEGTKHPLALVQGDTENATVVKRLLVGLRERGLDVTKPTLFVLDGAKALSTAVNAVFDHPVIARCEEHKVRMSVVICPRAWPPSSSAACAPPIATPTRSRAKATSKPSPASSTARIPARPLRYAKDWPRPSPSAASVSQRRWPARCARPTPYRLTGYWRSHSAERPEGPPAGSSAGSSWTLNEFRGGVT